MPLAGIDQTSIHDGASFVSAKSNRILPSINFDVLVAPHISFGVLSVETFLDSGSVTNNREACKQVRPTGQNGGAQRLRGRRLFQINGGKPDKI